MPRKLTRSKRRHGSAAELQAWTACFETGCDWGDLDEIGVHVAPTRVWRDPQYPAMQHSNVKEVLHGLAAEAWARLGAAYLRQRGDPPYSNVTPWALVEFGNPPGWTA